MSLSKHLVAALVAVSAATLAVGPAVAARPKKPTIDAPGELTLMSLTVGATIEVDGKVIGKVPLEDSLMLLPGKHTIKLTKRGFAPYEEEFEVLPGESVELEIDLLPFAGMVKINTVEPGATVKIDGQVEGVTPFDKDIPAGNKVITVSRPDHVDEVRQLLIKAGELYQLDIQLRPLPKKKVGDDGEAFYETWWFWTIVGVAGAGAAAAVVATSSGGTVTPTPAFSLQVP
jgi:hypothetical protein